MTEDKMSGWFKKATENVTKGVFRVPRGLKCEICLEDTHRIRDFPYTFERMWERMEVRESDNLAKKELSNKGGYVSEKNVGGNKKFSRSVLSKDEIMVKFEDVFYKEGEQIRFCNIEKCSIKTKRGKKW